MVSTLSRFNWLPFSVGHSFRRIFCFASFFSGAYLSRSGPVLGLRSLSRSQLRLLAGFWWRFLTLYSVSSLPVHGCAVLCAYLQSLVLGFLPRKLALSVRTPFSRLFASFFSSSSTVGLMSRLAPRCRLSPSSAATQHSRVP